MNTRLRETQRHPATGSPPGTPCDRPPVAAKTCNMSSKDWIGYARLVDSAQREMDRAQRGIVREALKHVAKGGVMGNHHFYITFDTRDPGVGLSDAMKARYPELITIVLQNQFWNLKVEDDAFEVGLSFNKVPEMLRVPFGAIRQFADPSQQFGLQFSAPPGTEAPPPPRAEEPSPQPQAPKASEDRSTEPKAADATNQTTEQAPGTDDQPPAPSSGPTVVSLDKFRKK